MSGIKRRMAAGLLALGTATSIGGTAGAAGAAEKIDDYKWRYENTLEQIDNPCTPKLDDITLAAEWHTQGKLWENNDGSRWYQGSNRGHLSGTSADGTGYVGAVQFQAQTRVEDGVISTVTDSKHLLVSQGDAPNFSLRYKVLIRFAADGSFSTMEILKEGTDCRG
jgi:hypothetical protein